MESKISVLESNEFGQVRIIEENGTILFCGKDVATALGYEQPTHAVTRHCKACTKRTHLSSRGLQETTFITEGDVYRLIVRSKLPAAERFEHWVFDEVLPSIRKHGAYMTDSLIGQVLEHPEIVYQMAEAMLDERKKNKLLEEELISARPKAAYYDAFVNPSDCTNIRTTAKEINVPEKKFTKFLQKSGYLYRAKAGNLLPYAKPSNKALFIVRDFYCAAGIGFYTLITPKGKELFKSLADQIRAMEM